MRLGALLGTVAGIVLSAWLLRSYGLQPILDLLARAGWGLAAVVAFHLVQLFFSAAAWHAIAGPTRPRPGVPSFVMFRWIREGVNNLLPVAQIGGEVVGARLVRRRGVPLVSAVAGAVADLSMEMVTQIAFTLLGLALLLLTVGDAGIGGAVLGGLLALGAGVACFLAAQWLGFAVLIERGLVRLGRAMGWEGFGEIAGLHQAITGLYRAPRNLLRAACCHSASWLLGGVEVWLALHVMGREIGAVPALVIESLGQALRNAGFAVPGALGVQEGGFIVVCHIFGLPPELAIALSLAKRLRDVVLGIPALFAWHRLEAGAVPAPSSGALP